MNLESLITDFRSAFVRCFDSPLARLGLIRRRQTLAPAVASTPMSVSETSTPVLVEITVNASGAQDSVAAPIDDEPPDSVLPLAVPAAALELPAESLPPVCPPLAADPELAAIRAKIASMEARVADFETRKGEMEQLLEEFAFCQYRALGELLGEHLHLQQEVLRIRAERSSSPEDRQAAETAAEEYAAYQQALDDPAPPLVILDEDDRKELTALYRAAAMRCHPDRVGEAEKDLAHETFLRMQDAYRRRDLAAMRVIGRQLADGDMAMPDGDDTLPRARLEALLAGLTDKGVELLMAIQSIQLGAQYRRARNREYWEEDFANTREQLKAECALLRRQLANFG